MVFPSFSLRDLSDQQLGDLLRDLRMQIAECRARLDSSDARRHRSLKLIRGTILAAGGFFGATLEPFVAFLVLLGAWDCVDAFVDDARLTNRQLALRQELIELEVQLTEAIGEVRLRKSQVSESQ